MMDDLRNLYQEVIFDHNRNPRNFHRMPGASHKAEGFNPLCGDQLTVYMKINEDGVIEDVSFEGKGCAISTASASIMTETLKGKTVPQAEQLFHDFQGIATGQKDELSAALGKLQVLAGVRDYPARVKCATLAWHTVHAALHDKGEAISTE
jgi:nitrogen fixation protein NifU and related proteins